MIGIIIADEHEINKIRWTQLETIEKAGFVFNLFEYKDKKIVVAHSGIGIVKSAACTQEMISSFAVKAIYNYGAVGSDEKHEIFDLVTPSKIYFHDVKTPWYPRGQVPGDVEYYINKLRKLDNVKDTNLASGMEFINSKEQLDSIKRELNVGIIDMETAGIMQIAYNNNVDVYVLKCISDIIGKDSSKLNDINTRIEEAGRKAFEYTIKLIEEK